MWNRPAFERAMTKVSGRSIFLTGCGAVLCLLLASSLLLSSSPSSMDGDGSVTLDSVYSLPSGASDKKLSSLETSSEKRSVDIPLLSLLLPPLCPCRSSRTTRKPLHWDLEGYPSHPTLVYNVETPPSSTILDPAARGSRGLVAQ